MSIKKYLIFILCLSGGFSAVQAQTEEDERIDALIDDILLEDGDILETVLAEYLNYQILYFSTNLETQTYFSGRKSAKSQFNLQPQLTYAHANGIYASVGGRYYSEIIPRWDVTSVSLGYLGNLDKKRRLKYNLGYAHYAYSEKNDIDLNHSLDVGLGWYNSKNSWGSLLSASYLFGKDKAWQFSWRSFARIKFWKTSKLSLSLRPQFSMQFAKQTLQLSRYRIRDGQLVLQTLDYDIFDLINSQLLVPVEFNTGSFDLNLGYTFNFPKALGREKKLSTNGFVSIGIGYMFSL